MPKLRKTWFYVKNGERRLNAYNVCISKKDVIAAGFDDNAMFKVSAEPGKITIEEAGEK